MISVVCNWMYNGCCFCHIYACICSYFKIYWFIAGRLLLQMSCVVHAVCVNCFAQFCWFLANVNALRYVCYMLWAVRLSSVVCLSVTLVNPTQAVELFGNFFSPYDSPGTLLFRCQKSLVGDAPFPLIFAFKVTHPLSNSEISTNIGS